MRPRLCPHPPATAANPLFGPGPVVGRQRFQPHAPIEPSAAAPGLRPYRPTLLVGIAGRTVSASPDHYQSQLITEASRFYSQLTKWNERFDGTDPFRIDHLVYRVLPLAAEITHWPSRFVVDISDTMEQKIEAIRCYESQFDAKRFAGLEHYVRSICGTEGVSIGVRYGEMYAMPRPLCVPDMVAALGGWQIPPPSAAAQEQDM